MKNVDELNAFFKRDRFVAQSGIRIADADEAYATAAVELRDQHLNAGDSAQGGLIFTLMDFAAAVHANRGDALAVTQSASVSYLHPPKGHTLSATARPVGETRRTAVYDVRVTDECGTSVAAGVFNLYRKGGI